MKLLLHMCCAPCATGALQSLSGDGYTVSGFYYNPNIHPQQEFQARKKSVEALSMDHPLPVIYDEEFMMDYWKENLSGTPEEKEKRCGTCYRMRIERTALTAAEKGFDAFTTSLLISPWQDHDRIKKLGEEAALMYGVQFLYRDFRPFFRSGKNEAYKRGYYMQKYCGCIYSYGESDHKKKPVYQFTS